MNVSAVGRAHGGIVRPKRLKTFALAGAIGALAVVFGVALTWVATRAGASAPLALVALVLLPLLALWILSDERVAIVCIIATFPISGLVGTLPGSPLSLVEVTVLAATGLVVLRRLGLGLVPLTFGDRWFIPAALFLWTLIAFPSAVDGTLAFKQLASLAGGLLLAIAVMTTCKRVKDVRLILAAFVIVAAAVSLAALLQGGEFSTEFGGAVVTGRLAGIFDSANQLGSLCGLALPLAVGLAYDTKSRRVRMSYLFAAALLCGGLLLSLSRGAWIGALMALVYLLFAVREIRTALLVAMVPLVVAALLLGTFAPSTPQFTVIGERVQSFTAENPYDSRPAIWAEARREIAADPWTGQGPGSFPVASERAASRSVTVSAQHAHNIWLTWGAESGLPAAILVLALGISGGVALSRVRRRPPSEGSSPRTLAAGMMAGLITIAGQGLVDYTLRNQIIFFSAWLLLGAAFALERSVLQGQPR